MLHQVNFDTLIIQYNRAIRKVPLGNFSHIIPFFSPMASLNTFECLKGNCMNILESVCQAMATCYGLRDEYHVQVSTPYKSVSTMNMVKKSEFVSQYE